MGSSNGDALGAGRVGHSNENASNSPAEQRAGDVTTVPEKDLNQL